MDITFLCPKHTEWVYSHPEQAVHFLARDEYQGSMLYADGQYREAIAYLGCAFDIAAILLEVDGGDNDAMRLKLESLGDLLSDAYNKLGLVHYKSAIEIRAAGLLSTMPYYNVAVLHA